MSPPGLKLRPGPAVCHHGRPWWHPGAVGHQPWWSQTRAQRLSADGKHGAKHVEKWWKMIGHHVEPSRCFIMFSHSSSFWQVHGLVQDGSPLVMPYSHHFPWIPIIFWSCLDSRSLYGLHPSCSHYCLAAAAAAPEDVDFTLGFPHVPHLIRWSSSPSNEIHNICIYIYDPLHPQMIYSEIHWTTKCSLSVLWPGLILESCWSP